ncbi:peptidoglycan-binding protein [Candidatus Parcubacteria bacterium]|jgi:peptidoglycan hydrolase-like protein with peptidoglycan-binding domain|nr:MAG: peptidoglycan-binding protein [Candidatus Parcubacteria bacterium]
MFSSKIGKSLMFMFAMVIVFASVFGNPLSADAETLNRQLDIESSGTDVSALQSFLAQDTSIYPERLVTGYFGPLTSSAVSKFQTKNGISAVGRVGPVTLLALNSQMSGGNVGGADISSPIIYNRNVGINGNTANVSWNTNELAKGMVYYSNTPLTTYEYPNSVDVSGYTAITDTMLNTTQNVSISGLLRNTTYYYLIYSTDQSGNVSVTWPSTFLTN